MPDRRVAVHARSHLPDVVGGGGAVRQLQGGEDDEVVDVLLRFEAGDAVVDTGGDDVEAADVVGHGGHAAVGAAVGEEGSGANHGRLVGVDAPGDPAAGVHRGGDEGEGEGGVVAEVGPVEGGTQGGEVYAGSIYPVIGETLGGAGS